MDKRYVGVLAAIVALAALAVLGAIGGGYLASRNEAASVHVTPTATLAPGPTLAPSHSPVRTSTGSENAASTPSELESEPEPEPEPESESPEEEQPARRTYQLDRVIYAEGSTSLTLVNVVVTGDRLRLNVNYRNGSESPWPLSCPTVDVDLVSSHLTLADGRIVRPESTWCAAGRAGKTFALAPGRQMSSWAVFPAVPKTGSSFTLTWYNFPVADGLRLG